MTTIRVAYMPQFADDTYPGGWVDMFNGLGFPDEGEAQRYVENSTIASRYVRRVMTETASIPVQPEPRPDGAEIPPMTPLSGIYGGGTALAVKPFEGYVEVGWTRYTIEQADELIAAIQRAQLKAVEQR